MIYFIGFTLYFIGVFYSYCIMRRVVLIELEIEKNVKINSEKDFIKESLRSNLLLSTLLSWALVLSLRVLTIDRPDLYPKPYYGKWKKIEEYE